MMILADELINLSPAGEVVLALGLIAVIFAILCDNAEDRAKKKAQQAMLARERQRWKELDERFPLTDRQKRERDMR